MNGNSDCPMHKSHPLHPTKQVRESSERTCPKRPWSKPSIRLVDAIARTESAPIPDGGLEAPPGGTVVEAYSPS